MEEVDSHSFVKEEEEQLLNTYVEDFVDYGQSSWTINVEDN